MSKLLANNYRFRRSFAKTRAALDFDNLIAIQLRSYAEFLQSSVNAENRRSLGLQNVFKSIFPIQDFKGECDLDFVYYKLEDPKHDVNECRERGQTYAAQLKVCVCLNSFTLDEETEILEFNNSIQEEVFFCDLPLMTKNGTFIINGTERVIVSQLHRSPGVFFSRKKIKTTAAVREVLTARIIPNRGSWIDFEFDTKDILHVRIDRRRKLPATILLRALGYDTSQLLSYFYDVERIYQKEEDGRVVWYKETPKAILATQTAPADMEIDGKVLAKGKKFLKKHIRKLPTEVVQRNILNAQQDVEVVNLPFTEEMIYVNGVGADNGEFWPKRYAATDIIDPENGEVLISSNEQMTEDKVRLAIDRGLVQFDCILIDNKLISPALRDTLMADKIDGDFDSSKYLEEDISSIDQAKIEIFRRLRPSDPATKDNASKYFEKLLNEDRYDLSQVGRLKLNHRLYRAAGESSDLKSLSVSNFEDAAPTIETTILTSEDLLRVVKYICDLKNNRPGVEIDDIDHLGNRRVRAVGELLENQFRLGLVRMEKTIREKMSLADKPSVQDIINSKPVNAAIKEFFGSSQLSQFMDQTNPLSEVTHKRRLSALGPGGLTRERAGGEVRDVHPTHYGRICPVETPEGPNVGLIASLASFAKVNEHGFIMTPYRKVENGIVTDQIRFYMALDEGKKVVVQASTELHDDGQIAAEVLTARQDGDVLLFNREDINLMDVGANQMVSVAASLVPFLENDDANRALMGSNMQRQAVPLLKTCAPLVGTGMERIVARDSGVTTRAKRSGIITDVDSKRIVLQSDAIEDTIGGDVEIYTLTKFRRSNQSTCINQRPLVKIGDRVEVGDIIADGPATDIGELALGQNPIVAFMPWQGYNFEDSILISERVVRDDVYTSIHIEEFDVAARDTKLGKEEITRDIPGVGDDALASLDESGIIRVGAYVRPGDILVGKITPKGETQLSPEERLLRAIFGEKANDFKDSSLRARPGVEGVVIHADVFHRDSEQQDERSKEISELKEEAILRDQNQKIKAIRQSAKRKLIHGLVGKVVAERFLLGEEELFEAGAKLTEAGLQRIPMELFETLFLEDEALFEQIYDVIDITSNKTRSIERVHRDKVTRLSKGDDLPPGVIKKVVVYIAIKRKLQVGDKMAGRHGNKGVVSRVMPIENMPYLEDGTPVDIVLNPLGVPSRMNVGQVLETHLGWAARGMGVKLQTMLEEARSAEELRQFMVQIFEHAPDVAAFIKKASYDQLKTMAKKYKSGVTLATPVFDGASEKEIKSYLKLADLDEDGQTILFDGRTGEAFDNRVTVGVMYILKLHHLVDEKLHARSIGPYSLVTQQPLGGKAQFGGQRLGEMEVWALEAYGAAYSLQEFLTVKSDDVKGRTRMYESIVKGDNTLEAGLPESFNVLVKELQALALNVELIKDTDIPAR
jgi:DNA-directed RNA polymerase subunit beta